MDAHRGTAIVEQVDTMRWGRLRTTPLFGIHDYSRSSVGSKLSLTRFDPHDSLFRPDIVHARSLARSVAQRSSGQGPLLILVVSITSPGLQDVPVRLVPIGQVQTLTLILNGEMIVPSVGQPPFLRGQAVVALDTRRGKPLSSSVLNLDPLDRSIDRKPRRLTVQILLFTPFEGRSPASIQ